jgi:hypothetical protein
MKNQDARKPYTCPECGSKVGSIRRQQLRTYVDIDVDEDGEVGLRGSENEVMEETWEFFCLSQSEHVFSAQMLAALNAMIEQQSEFGLDF